MRSINRVFGYLLPTALSAIVLWASGCGASKDANPARASIQVVGLKSEQMQYHVAQQEASNWCWAACVQMVMSVQGIAVSQTDIVAHVSDGLVWDRPGSSLDVLLVLNSVSTDPEGRNWQLQATAKAGAPSFEEIERQFQQGLPLIIGYNVPHQTVGHAAVITAVIYRRLNGHIHVLKILIRDPSPLFYASGGKRELTWSEFNQIFVHYLVSPKEL